MYFVYSVFFFAQICRCYVVAHSSMYIYLQPLQIAKQSKEFAPKQNFESLWHFRQDNFVSKTWLRIILDNWGLDGIENDEKK